MESIKGQLERAQTHVPPAKPSKRLADSPERTAAVQALIQKTQRLRGLPLLQQGPEMAIELATWDDVIKDIPDRMLAPAWERATAGHDWNRPFPLHAIKHAYKDLVIEDRERLEKAKARAAWNDQFLCPFCEDSGYALILVHCPTRQNDQKTRRACDCEMTPDNQRLPQIIDRKTWTRGNHGYWISPDPIPCNCKFCKKTGR